MPARRCTQKSHAPAQALTCDEALSYKIRGICTADDTLKGLDISVDTAQGVVTLTGPRCRATRPTAKELATQIAQGVEGVVRVDNQLTVQ